jgi:hypothetical protein
MPGLLTPDDYPPVRREIGFPEGTDDFLPDGDTGAHARQAAVYYAAHLLLRKSLGELQAAFNAVSGGQGASATSGWREKWDWLLQAALSEIAAITATEIVDEPTVPPTSTAAVSVRF